MSEFEGKLREIKINGHVYHIKCDLFVLNKIQDKYGDLDAFRLKLSGLIPVLDDSGNLTYDDDGTIKNKGFGIPDIHALTDTLVWMVQEGEEIAGNPEIEEKKILQSIDIPINELKWIVHEEYMRSLVNEKNAQTAPDQESTSR
jgi:hypothetical protein